MPLICPPIPSLPKPQAEVDVLEAELQGAARLLEAKLRALHRVLTPAQAVALEQALASS